MHLDHFGTGISTVKMAAKFEIISLCRVRFYACESLYNVTKVTRDDILPLFNDIFVAMARVVTDLDLSVRNAAELLDRFVNSYLNFNVDLSTFNERSE